VTDTDRLNWVISRSPLYFSYYKSIHELANGPGYSLSDNYGSNLGWGKSRHAAIDMAMARESLSESHHSKEKT
jgi:hypothetical protein